MAMLQLLHMQYIHVNRFVYILTYVAMCNALISVHM